MNNIDRLLEKYWEAETSLEEEKELKAYFASGNVAEEHLTYKPLFNHFAAASASLAIDVEDIIRKEVAKDGSTGRVVEMKSQSGQGGFRRYMPMVAAASIFMLVTLVGIRWYKGDTYSGIHPNVVVLEGEEDTEEAVRVTKEALALLSNGYNKGTSAVMELQHVRVVNQALNK